MRGTDTLNATSGAIATAIEGTGIHLYLGIGAAPEGVLACSAMKSIGGCFMGRFAWRSPEEKARAVEMGTKVKDSPHQAILKLADRLTGAGLSQPSTEPDACCGAEAEKEKSGKCCG